MGKQIQGVTLRVLCLVLLGIAVAVVHGVAQGPEAVDDWFTKMGRAKEKLTKLHFYFHEMLNGNNPTVIAVTRPDGSPTKFGLVLIADDPLTVGPDPNSMPLGRAQGFYCSADQNEFGLAMYVNYYFTAGEYKGSTLSLLGRNAAFQNNTREMSIVGGTGVFRLARGIATAKTCVLNITGHTIVEYNVVVLHY